MLGLRLGGLAKNLWILDFHIKENPAFTPFLIINIKAYTAII